MLGKSLRCLGLVCLVPMLVLSSFFTHNATVGAVYQQGTGLSRPTFKTEFRTGFKLEMDKFELVGDFAEVDIGTGLLDEFFDLLKKEYINLPIPRNGVFAQGTLTQWQGQYTGNIYTDYTPPSMFDIIRATNINQFVFEQNKPIFERAWEIQKGLGAIEFIKKYEANFKFLKANPTKKGISSFFVNFSKHNGIIYFKDGFSAAKGLENMKSNINRAKTQVVNTYSFLKGKG